MRIADTDIVSRIEIGLDTADLDAALEALRPVVRAVRAWRLEVGPANSRLEDGYQALVSVRSPLLDGETVKQALRRVVNAQMEALGLAAEEVEVLQFEGRPFARVRSVTQESVAEQVHGGITFLLFAKQGRDPFDTESEEPEVESLEDVEDEVILTDEERRELGMLVRAVTTTQVMLVGVVTGVDEIDAHQLVRDLADRVRRALLPDSVETMTSDPRRLEDGSIRVECVAGGTELIPQEAVDTVTALLNEFIWTPPERVNVRPDQDYIAAEARPQGGFTRLEVHASPGLGWFEIEPG